MKLNHLYGCLLSLISGATLLATTCAAQGLGYVGTQAQAIARAPTQGEKKLNKIRPVAALAGAPGESHSQSTSRRENDIDQIRPSRLLGLLGDGIAFSRDGSAAQAMDSRLLYLVAGGY